MADTTSTARTMRAMFEQVHDVTYFAPEALRAFTGADRAAHNAAEAATGQAAERPWNRMGAAGLAGVAGVLAPLARARDAALPEVMPIGRLQPARPDRTGAHHRGRLHDLSGNPAQRPAGGALAAAARSGFRERTAAARETGPGPRLRGGTAP